MEQDSVEANFSETHVPQDVLDKIASLHFNPKGTELGKLLMPDGTYEKTYIIEGDIAMTANQLK